MKNIRVLSAQTNIYHRQECRYVFRIKNANRRELPPYEARQAGYRPCRYCNTMAFLYETEWNTLRYFERKWKMHFLLLDGILYVQTAIGCWKLVYSKKEEKIVLYHRSRSSIPADFTQPQKERYHRQTDCANGNTISAICKYIYEHDRYREAREKGEMLTTYTSKRSRILAEKAQKKEKRKRLDDLFRQLEENNAGYRELSYC